LYLHGNVSGDPDEDGWDDYQNFFEACSQLKGIQINAWGTWNFNDKSYFSNILPTTISRIENPTIQEIWKNRILYIKSLGVKIVPENEILCSVDNLIKEANISWRFEMD
jgi:hypothetical protein